MQISTSQKFKFMDLGINFRVSIGPNTTYIEIPGNFLGNLRSGSNCGKLRGQIKKYSKISF
jgi:hypothetical protein